MTNNELIEKIAKVIEMTDTEHMPPMVELPEFWKSKLVANPDTAFASIILTTKRMLAADVRTLKEHLDDAVKEN